jgi:hypothetical protein
MAGCGLALIVPLVDYPGFSEVGKSTVLMYDHSGNNFVGSLERAFKAGAGWVQGWRYLGIIHRIEHDMTRPDDYEYLLALCRNEIPKAEAQDLLVN